MLTMVLTFGRGGKKSRNQRESERCTLLALKMEKGPCVMINWARKGNRIFPGA